MKDFILLTAAVSLFVLAGFYLKVDQRDIDICMESTNYSSDRCLFEITR